MPKDISPTTGEEYYSGTYENVLNVLRVLSTGQGKLAKKITEDLINEYQETIDRDIDGNLEDVYHVPFRAMNLVNPLGDTVRAFPGDLKRCALYWTSGLILLNEFQQLSENVTEQATTYIDDARRMIFDMKRFHHRMRGQERKSHISRTMPPSLQPPAIPEPNF